MAKFTQDCYYIVQKNVFSTGSYTEFVFYTKEIYKEGSVTRAKGPGLYRYINGVVYIGSDIDVIPKVYTKDKDAWKRITRKEALYFLFDKVFSDKRKVIKDLTELEKVI